MKYKDQVIRTSDGKDWIYDSKHHVWIEVTKPTRFGPIIPLR